ncbi:YeeE/YedE family protein [Halolamina litorea]|uniref:YeeE/YedE family protein n=1 Tax=Halolamina litorea TaxID=1515593 RepID=UPI002271C097|nr:YeeE/YedE thiosulfate transporter family protein [Halolamina litorea]
MVLDSLTLFPEGIAHYLLGGLLIGAATAVIYLGTGIAAGASTFLESTLSYVSNRERFQQFRFVQSRDWRLVFTVGIVLGAAAYTALSADPWFVTEVSPTRLFVGGVLVGVGTRVGKGCTSGHGICGVGSLAEASLVNVATFVAVAAGTAQLLFALGVRP